MVVIGGENYGQGSSREHAALCPMFLGVQAVIAQSFARIHLANLINFGILPLVFKEEEDYRALEQGDELEIAVGDLGDEVTRINVTKKKEIPLIPVVDEREKILIKRGGALPFVKGKR